MKAGSSGLHFEVDVTEGIFTFPTEICYVLGDKSNG